MVNTHKVDTRDKHRHGGQGLEPGQSGKKADTRRTKCGDVAKAESRRTQGGHMRTRFGGPAKADTRRTQADTWRTNGGQAPGTQPEHIAASLFCLLRITLHQHRPQTVFQA